MTDDDRLVSWTESSAEMGRLESEWADGLSLVDPGDAARRRDRLRTERERRSLEGYLWEHPRGRARGFVACRPVENLGRRVEFLFLEDGARDGASLGSLFDLLNGLPGGPGPVFASTGLFLGVPLDVQSRVLTPRGFVHVDQERMVFRAVQAVPEERPSAAVPLRHPEPGDTERLIDLYVRAYRTDPTQLLLAQVRLRDEAASFVRGAFAGSGEYDPLSTEFSFVAEQGGAMVGAIIVLDVPAEGPFISDLIVDPSTRRRGLGRRLIVRMLSAVRDARPSADVRLTVETQNRPAYALYTSLGFASTVPGPGQRWGAWLRRATVEQVVGTDSGWSLAP